MTASPELTIDTKTPASAYPVLLVASRALPAPKVSYSQISSPFALSTAASDAPITDQLQAITSLSPSPLSPWVERAVLNLSSKNFALISSHLEDLDSFLNLRSVIDYSPSAPFPSASDIAVFGVLRANPLLGSILKSQTFQNVSRWYAFLAPLLEPVVESAAAAIAALRKALQPHKKKEAHKASFDIDLPGAEMGKVVTRFPPEPSGYLHIGHAKAAILNEYFAHAYQGKLIVRFDDTNPSKERMEFQDSILEDLSLLGIKPDTISYSSDYFDHMYDLACRLIRDGHAYCDDTPQEQMRHERMVGEKSQHRDRPVLESLRIFTKEMKSGSELGARHCLRAKMDYANPNKALRDPVIYRCNSTPHHRTGTAWKMYPTYDFCVPVVDSLEGVTHALRTNEYRDRNPQYQWFIDTLQLRPVAIWDFGRVNFVRTLLSKRKLQWFVDQGHVANWDDPRFPTVRGVRRRGMTVEGLRAFILSQGPSRNIINLDWLVIWALNKKVIDPVAPRFTAVLAQDAVAVTIDGGPSLVVTEDRPQHKKNPALGTKKLCLLNRVLIDQADAATLAEGEEVTFMDWGNVIVNKIHRDGDTVTQVAATLHLEGDFRKTEKKLTWLADTDNKTQVDIVDFDHLITKDKLEELDDFADFLTPVTETHASAYADVNVGQLPSGSIIQLERKGYYRVDVAAKEGQPAVLFTIPDGKTVSRYGAKK